MEIIKENGVTTYKFEAIIRNHHELLTIVDGEIQEAGGWDPRNGVGRRKGDSGFIESCYSTIRFFENYKPKELEKIYNVLADGVMKDFCKKLQQEKLADFNF